MSNICYTFALAIEKQMAASIAQLDRATAF